MGFPAKLLDKLAPKEGLVLLCLAILVGTVTGLAAVGFIHLISFIQTIGYTTIAGSAPGLGRLWYIIIPVLGAAVGGPIIAYFAVEARGHGVPEVMQALMLRGGRIRPRVAMAKIVASSLCIGTGGSAGREGPIVQVGSTLGSTIGQFLKLSDDRIKNLVACGAAAGIAATFNAPIAGITFSIEVLLCELQVAVFGNVVIAAVAASIVSRIFLGARPAFDIPTYVLHSPWEILLYIILGLLAALVGVMFIRMLDGTETYFDRLAMPVMVKPILGAMLLGAMSVIYPAVSVLLSVYPDASVPGQPLVEGLPHVYGSGFHFLHSVLLGQEPFGLLLILVFLKPIATSFTLGSGNSGGVFAPSLFTGAVLGGSFGHVVKFLLPKAPIETGAYALVGMAAVFAAAARAPLTAMLIVFEMSNDYQLILPLMAAGMTASFFAQWLHADSIYSVKLTKRGIRFEGGRDLDIMQGVRVEEVMNHAPVTIHKDQSAADLFTLFQETHLQGFPVMASDEDLHGIVTLQDMERALQNQDRAIPSKHTSLRNVKVSDVATRDIVTVFPDEPIWAAIRKMAPRDLARVPVVSRHNPRKLIGLISRSDILRAYQIGILRKQRQQSVHERLTLRKIDDAGFLEITIPVAGGCVDIPLAKLALPHNATVVSVNRHGTILLPRGATTFMPEDRVTIFCLNEDRTDIEQLMTSP